MRYGIILPGGTAVEQLEQAVLAEESGWDGVFVWEAAYGVDAWGLLSAIAARTSRVTLGTALTPLPWRRPWKVASQVVTLDQISGGRALLMVGLGALTTDLPLTGEEVDLRKRAALMDEGIDLVRELWRGGSHYHGEHYTYVVAQGETLAGDPSAAASAVVPWVEAGATWWLETRWDMPHHSTERMRQVRDRLAAGPPRVG